MPITSTLNSKLTAKAGKVGTVIGAKKGSALWWGCGCCCCGCCFRWCCACCGGFRWNLFPFLLQRVWCFRVSFCRCCCCGCCGRCECWAGSRGLPRGPLCRMRSSLRAQSWPPPGGLRWIFFAGPDAPAGRARRTGPFRETAGFFSCRCEEWSDFWVTCRFENAWDRSCSATRGGSSETMATRNWLLTTTRSNNIPVGGL